MTWRLMRSTSGPAVASSRCGVRAPGGAGDVDHEVGAALELVGDAEGHPDEAEVGRARGPSRPMIRRHSSSIAWRSESMASSSATTRSAWSRSAARRASVPAADGVEGQRRQAHDVEAHVVDQRTDLRIGLVGHDLRGDHVAIIVACRERGRAAPPTVCPCSPSRHHVGHGASTVPSYAPRRNTNQSTFQEEHPHAPFVRSSRRHRARRVGAAGAAHRQRRDRHHAVPGEARLGHPQR